ncbi:zinc-ribbon and DUF3426 domain-containing protein [Paralcaligenes ginsengisoli]
MDLSTQCPRCGSVFPASLEQLQLRKGYIRCVSCAHIFDGYEAVVSGDGSSAGAAPPSAPEPSVVRQRSAQAQETRPLPSAPTVSNAPDAPPAAPAFTISSTRTVPLRLRAEPVLSVPRHTEQREAEPSPASFYVGGEPAPDAPEIYIEPRRADEDQLPLPAFLDERYERRHGFARVFWGALCLMALAVLLAQVVYVYRANIANHSPALRPILTKACASLKCDVPYSRRILLISIMNSSLRAGPKGAGADKDTSQMTLQLTLRNNYDKPQEWPTLTLDLVDFSGVVVARKNLPPKSYLTAKLLEGPFAAHGEIVATVPITVAGVKVNGFQLGKFFP